MTISRCDLMLFHAPPVSHLEAPLWGVRDWVKLLPWAQCSPPALSAPLASEDSLKAVALQQTLCGWMSNFSHFFLPSKSSSFSKDWFSISNFHSRGCLPKTKCGSWPIETSISIHCHKWATFLSLWCFEDQQHPRTQVLICKVLPEVSTILLFVDV